MELQPITSSASSTKRDRFIQYVRERWVRLAFYLSMLFGIAVILFMSGYFSGTNASVSRKGPSVNHTALDIEWSGACPKKLLTCPKSYQGVPPLILISLDGFRPDYLNRGFTPTLDNIAQCGTSAPYMYSVFPSKTFPNHYSIVTGLHPESHGITGNTMYDPTTGATFTMGSPESENAHWWESEPIWVTAQNQGKRSYCFYWVGSEVEIKGVRPTFYETYNEKLNFETRADTVLEWLDLPNNTRPNFITLYVYQPDYAGHKAGTKSRQVNDALGEVDRMVARLFNGLQQRGLLNCVNVIILSDHGMADVNCKRVIELQNYVNASDVEATVLGAFGRLRPTGEKNDTVDEQLISNLQCKSKHMRVYQKQQLPVRYHYSHHRRIEPIFLDLDYGWSVSIQNKYKNCKGGGSHGYDNYFHDMRALFMAYGPSFKFNQTVKPFANIELYEMMTELLNITANPNNGTKGSLHHLLQDPQTILGQTEPIPPQVGTVPSSKVEFDLRVQAANCICIQKAEPFQIQPPDVISVHHQHLPFGIPITWEHNETHLLLYNNDYVATYDSKYRSPIWSSFSLSQKQANIKEVKPCWQGDARIPLNETSTCSDYNSTLMKKQNIEQRPLFPPTFANEHTLDEAFLVTNSVPKHEQHVAHIERAFNRLLSSWVRLKGSLNIIAGPAFDVQATGLFPGYEQIKQTSVKYGFVVVPTHYFYVVTWCEVQTISVQDCDSSKLEVAAFLLPNVPIAYNCESADELIKKHVARVIDVEALTGMYFFTKLPIYDAIRLRTSVPEI